MHLFRNYMCSANPSISKLHVLGRSIYFETTCARQIHLFRNYMCSANPSISKLHVLGRSIYFETTCARQIQDISLDKPLLYASLEERESVSIMAIVATLSCVLYRDRRGRTLLFISFTLAYVYCLLYLLFSLDTSAGNPGLGL